MLDLQRELLKAQRWVESTGQRVVILFEGRDAAGKGGTIKRFMEHMNPRTARVVALQKPTERERTQWFFQRYIAHLPAAGELVLFDRSWYNRAGVERVMGFCTPAEYLEFMRQCPELERMMARSGIMLFKYWFSVSRDEQRRRFEARETDPLKQWKLSPIDRASLGKWDEYTEAKEAMFFYTDTADAPWTIVKADDKKRARLNCMQHFLGVAAVRHQGPQPGDRAGPADRRQQRPCDRHRPAHHRQDGPPGPEARTARLTGAGHRKPGRAGGRPGANVCPLRAPVRPAKWPASVAPVAQLDRALDYGSGGWEFESLRARQIQRLTGSLLAGMKASLGFVAGAGGAGAASRSRVSSFFARSQHLHPLRNLLAAMRLGR